MFPKICFFSFLIIKYKRPEKIIKPFAVINNVGIYVFFNA